MINELEVIAFDINSCKIASENGADRIELCDNPYDGGTTPSYGMIAEARKISSIQLFPIIRPRGGDFLYSQEELIGLGFCTFTQCAYISFGYLHVPKYNAVSFCVGNSLNDVKTS